MIPIEYVKSRSTIKPNLIEVEPYWVYLHKNITSEVDENGITFYSYEEARLTLEEFNANANSILMTGQEDMTENQLTIMEAFADLYETIAFNM